jgi:type VI secretion system secreted protein VgrG
MPPWDLPANATQSGFLTRTRDGTPRTANAFMFEDKPGQEEVWMHAERNMRTEVEADELRTVDGMRTTTIGRDDFKTVLGSRIVHVTGTDLLTVGSTRTVTVTGNETYTVNSARTLHVAGGLTTENYDQGLKTTVAADGETREVTGLFKETLHTGEQVVVTSGDSLHEIQAGTLTEKAKGKVSVQSLNAGMDLIAQDQVLMQSQTANMKIMAAQQIHMESTGAGIDIVAKAPITLTSQANVVLQGKSVKEFSTKSWYKWTPYALNTAGAQATFGGANVQGWAFQSSNSGIKIDFSLLKSDNFYISQKAGALELKNKGLDSTTGTLGTALWALSVWY